jgi:tetratricopeptide (TPR) repeat protein
MTFDELESAMGVGLPTAMTHRSPVRRHRSPESLVTWSADLLDPSVRDTLTKFSVFAGPVSGADALAVLATDHQVTAFDLAALSERSLLTADVDGPASRYRMLDMVKSVAGQWLEESGSSDVVRRRHAEHFADVVRRVDRDIRTPDEAVGRRRLDGVAAEVRAAHRWASRHDPALASDMSAALHLAAYSTFWNEPTEWARALLATEPDSDVLDGARLAVAGTAANVGDLAEAYELGTRAARSSDLRVRATALEILADVAIYDGRLADVAPLADELERLGEELGDAHFRTVAVVDASLALSFAGEARLGLARLGDFDPTVLAPSDHAWLVYTRGEALSAMSDPAAAATFAHAVELASGIGNPFVTSVSRVSLAAELTRSGEFRSALDAYSQCLREYSRHGNYVHAVTTLRNLIETLVAVGDDEGAAILAGATADDRLRPSYGEETERLGDVVAGVEARLGAKRAGELRGAGRQLDVPAAVRKAVTLVEGHRS